MVSSHCDSYRFNVGEVFTTKDTKSTKKVQKIFRPTSNHPNLRVLRALRGEQNNLFVAIIHILTWEFSLQMPADLGQKDRLVDGFGDIAAAAGGQRLIAVSRHGVRSHRDHRDFRRRRFGP